MEDEDKIRRADSLALTDEVLLHLKGQCQERLIHSRSQGDQAAGEFSDSPPATWVSSSFKGRVRRGEEGNERICNILIVRLNRDRSSPWRNCVACEDRNTNVDCIAVDGSEKLLVQLTRAEQRRDFWLIASRGSGTADYTGKEEAADALREAIEAKINVKFASIALRRGIHLALDASDTLGFVLRPVIESFRKRHGAWARALGFMEIWLIGPTPDFTERLDWESDF